MEKFRTARTFRREISIAEGTASEFGGCPRSICRYLTSLLSPGLEQERSSKNSDCDIPCSRSSVFLPLEQSECSTDCTRRDVPEAEQRQLSFSYLLTTLPWFRRSLKPIHPGLTVIRLMAAFGFSAGQQQLSRRDGFMLSLAAIQPEKNWRLALAAMHAEIPPCVGRCG
jgi:hypothetical protein